MKSHKNNDRYALKSHFMETENMLYRKISKLIEEHLKSNTQKILLIDGARQVGKTYIVRHVSQ